MDTGKELDEVYEPEGLSGALEDVNIMPKIKIDLEEEDKANLDYIQNSIEERVRSEYAQAFAIENMLLAKVRTRLAPSLGDGWVMNPDGSYVEDWSKITTHDMESFIQEASAWAFFSSQNVISSYADAVFAKFSYDDAYDSAYSAQLTGTIGDKSAKAKRRTQQERWVALYKTLYYKRAKEIVDRLDQHVRRVERIYTERQKEAERKFRAAR